MSGGPGSRGSRGISGSPGSRFADLSVRGSYADFQIRGIDLALVNAMRRAVLADVQTAAFCFVTDAEQNTVDIVTNTSVLHNEFLGHRISLLPIHLSENETLDVVANSATHGSYEFHLAAKNTNADASVERSPMDVTTAMIEGTLGGTPLSAETLARFFPADPVSRDHILITRLKAASSPEVNDAEALEFRATLRMGAGKDHSRWTPTSLCTYGNKIDEAKAAVALAEEVEKALASNATAEEVDRLVHDFNSMGRHRCFLVDEHGEPAEFNFKIRSECGLRPTYIIFKGLLSLLERLEQLSANVSKAQATDPAHPEAEVTMDAYGAVPGMYQFSVEHEDHTLGNLVQSFLFNSHIRDSTSSNELEYVGYHQPHPLEHRIVFRVKVKPKSQTNSIQAFMSTCITQIAEDVRDVMYEFIAFASLSDDGIRDVDAFVAAKKAVAASDVATVATVATDDAMVEKKKKPAKKKTPKVKT